MDLDKFIGDNIDDILDNPDDYIFDNVTNRKPFQNNKKKVSFNYDPTYDLELTQNNQQTSNISEYDYYEKYYDIDIYNEDYDDFGYVYKKNNSDSDSDTNFIEEPISIIDTNPKLNKDINEPNEDDYSQDIIGDLYQDLYQNKNQKTDIFEMFKKITGDKTKLSQSEQIAQLIELDKISQITQNTSDNFNNDNDIENDDGYYFINLINIFTKYYNNKFDRVENFFSGIKNNDKDTSYQMELFFDAIVEYKTVKKSFDLDDKKCMEMIYLDDNIYETSNTNSPIELPNNKILDLFSKWENQIYMLDLGNKRYISPSLLICLNYLFENKIDDNYWDIYNLKNV